MIVKIVLNDRGNPPRKLADAELLFTDGDGVLAGLRLIGFGIWQGRDGQPQVTLPARQYSVNGERRSYSLLRPTVEGAGQSAQEALREAIVIAYEDTIRQQAEHA